MTPNAFGFLKKVKSFSIYHAEIPYLCPELNIKTNMTKETLGADFKSATDNKKLFIETYGCQMNVADSEVVASIMQMAG